MREILFRAKCGNVFKEGRYFRMKDDDGTIHHMIEMDFTHYFITDPETIGQYTGIEDKKGNKIFEGDELLDNVGNKSVVIWRYSSWGLDFGTHQLNFPNKYTVTIIGNIHQNKDLLK